MPLPSDFHISWKNCYQDFSIACEDHSDSAHNWPLSRLGDGSVERPTRWTVSNLGDVLSFWGSSGSAIDLNTLGIRGHNLSEDARIRIRNWQGAHRSGEVIYDSAGAVYMSIDGQSGNYASTPDHPEIPSTDISIQAKLFADDWSAGEQTIAAQWNTSSQKAWRFYKTSSERLALKISSDGSAEDIDVTSDADLPFSGNENGFVGVFFDQSESEVKFYTSTDGDNWTQLGSTVAGSSTGIFDSNANIEIGSHNGGNDCWSGGIYWVQVSDEWSGDPACYFQAANYNGSGTTLLGRRGPNLITNGNFDTDVDSWDPTFAGGTILWEGGSAVGIDRNVARVTATDSLGNVGGNQEITCEAGRQYLMSYRVYVESGDGGTFAIGTAGDETSASDDTYISSVHTDSDWTRYVDVFEASQTQHFAAVRAETINQRTYWDEIIVQLGEIWTLQGNATISIPEGLEVWTMIPAPSEIEGVDGFMDYYEQTSRLGTMFSAYWDTVAAKSLQIDITIGTAPAIGYLVMTDLWIGYSHSFEFGMDWGFSYAAVEDSRLHKNEPGGHRGVLRDSWRRIEVQFPYLSDRDSDIANWLEAVTTRADQVMVTVNPNAHGRMRFEGTLIGQRLTSTASSKVKFNTHLKSAIFEEG